MLLGVIALKLSKVGGSINIGIEEGVSILLFVVVAVDDELCGDAATEDDPSPAFFGFLFV
jgi:hypothetical protein